eukprot:1342434-Pyramimonas_sp.AAC.1
MTLDPARVATEPERGNGARDLTSNHSDPERGDGKPEHDSGTCDRTPARRPVPQSTPARVTTEPERDGVTCDLTPS